MIQAVAPAKINLSLHITGKRADGYHTLQSIVTFSDFGDEITLSPSKLGPAITLEGPFSSGLSSSDNLALKALHLICAALKINPQFHIHLVKKIPYGAGLGGGSADAACIIKLVLKYTKMELPAQQLNDLLLSLGADVPICYYGKTAFMQGIGEQISALKMPEFFAVLACPPIHCVTKDLFRQIYPPYTQTMPCPSAVSLEALTELNNDFTVPAIALHPELALVQKALEKTEHVKLIRLSGSGACWFGLYARKPEALRAAQTLSNAEKSWFIQPVCLNASL